MQFDSWSAFWNMGGYAFYVWLSFGVAFVSMLALGITSAMRHKRLLKLVLSEQARQERIKAARSSNQSQNSNFQSLNGAKSDS